MTGNGKGVAGQKGSLTILRLICPFEYCPSASSAAVLQSSDLFISSLGALKETWYVGILSKLALHLLDGTEQFSS